MPIGTSITLLLRISLRRKTVPAPPAHDHEGLHHAFWGYLANHGDCIFSLIVSKGGIRNVSARSELNLGLTVHTLDSPGVLLRFCVKLTRPRW